MRNAIATIDLKALIHNYETACKLSNTDAIAVIKADAYGHGAVKCANALLPFTKAFAVATIEEAIDLREHGIQKPILLLEGIFTPSDLELVIHYNFWLVVHSLWQLEVIEKSNFKQKLTVFLKIDTGMHRVGFSPDKTEAIYQRLMNSQKTANIIIMTHFAAADEIDNPYTEKQYQVFQNSIKNINCPVSLSNSAAILGHASIKNNWVRPGIMLYGSSPFDEEFNPLLKPVMTLTSQIIAVNFIDKNEPIGYAGTFTSTRKMRLGVVAMGYADGYPRQIKANTKVYINGFYTTIVGRVSMDMILVDLTDLPDHISIGSTVEFFGKHISASSVAKSADTISYQVFCNIKRVKKIYLD